ncbi:MAG: hypothetical protein ACXVEF_32580 [Polyangiales bacterium]
MRVQLAYPGATPQQVEGHLRAVFPRYSVIVRAGNVIVGDGAATGVLVKRGGPGDVTLIWAFPNMAVQMVLTLAIVLTGILPGLVLFGITWLVVRSGVARLKQEVATVLAGGAPPVQTALPANGAAPTAPPSPLGLVASILAFVIALFSLISMGQGFGFAGALFWIAAGAAGCMLHFEQKRAFETRTAAAGGGRLVLAIAAIVHGLLALVSALSTFSDFYLARGIFSSAFFVGAGVVLILVHTGKLAAEKMLWTQLVAGAVLALFGVLGFYDLIDILDHVDFNVFSLALAARSLAWIALGGILVARGLTSRSGQLPQPLAA